MKAPAPGPAAPSDFLSQLAPDELDALRALGRSRAYARGEYVFRAADPGKYVFFLEKGRIKIAQLSPLGREVILWFCFPGEIFGLAEVARGGGRVVNAQAVEPSQVLAVPQDDYRAYLEKHPGAALLSMQVLSSRLRILGEMLVNLVADDVNTRIAKLILRLSARFGTRVGKDIVLAMPLTQQEMADMVGTTRQTVSTVLGQLKRQGVLSIDGHRILIESEDLLAGLSQGEPGAR